MYIYKHNKQNPAYHILDPDYSYHSVTLEEHMYDYFKSLQIIPNPQNIAGIYIQYTIKDTPFEKYPLFYLKLLQKFEKNITKYFNFGNANLFIDYSNFFFITMFDVTEEQIQSAFLKFYQKLIDKKLNYHNKEYSFNIHCGVYISHTYISPKNFIMLTKEQFDNTIQHSDSIFSIKDLSYCVIHDDDKNIE